MPWAYDRERYERVARERKREQQSMLSYLATTGCRMEFLRRELDDPDSAVCGRCDNCTGVAWAADVSPGGDSAARERLARPGVEVEPRKMWPAGMKELGIDVSGKIHAARVAAPGRALGRLTDVGWGATLRALLAEGAPDQPVTAPLTNAIVKVLAAWDWAQRPASVVTLPSRTRPLLIGSLGRRIAEIGRLTYLGALDYATPDGPGPRRHNSAQRLASLWRSLVVPDDLRDALSTVDAPVLLIDDQIDTGWTMTVAAALLRDAGASAVLPLALATSTGLGSPSERGDPPARTVPGGGADPLAGVHHDGRARHLRYFRWVRQRELRPGGEHRDHVSARRCGDRRVRVVELGIVH
jgi:ATP-dependent DNA helicase RecQ